MDNDTIYRPRVPLYGMLDAGGLFDDFYAGVVMSFTFQTKTQTFGMTLVEPDVTKHVFALVPMKKIEVTPAAVCPTQSCEAGRISPEDMLRFKGELGWLAVKGEPRIAAATWSIQPQLRPTRV